MSIPHGNRKIRGLDEIEVEAKTVFCRVDYNVPIKDSTITDDTRIRATLPTVMRLLDRGARVVLASHLGRPKGKRDTRYSLLPIAQRLAEFLGREVIWIDDCVGNGVKAVLAERKKERVFLLENLRYHAAEEADDETFARHLRETADVYVSDAFGAMHREHASVHALPRLFETRAAGTLVEKELKALFPLLEGTGHPYSVILGGAKVSDKIAVIENLLRKVDRLFLGGAMVFTFLKAMGRGVGNSLVEEDKLSLASHLLEEAKRRNVSVYLPYDFRLGRSIDQPGEARVSDGTDVPDGWMGLDIGPKTVESFGDALRTSQTIFWNGPVGMFETPPYDQGTLALARLLGELKCVRVIGGGDSAAAVTLAGMADRMTHVSTGGGATLEFLEGRGLPGLDALAV